MVGNPEDRSSRWGPDNFCDPVSFPQIDILFFSSIINVSSDKVCFKRFDFTYIWASWACVITIWIPLWIYESHLLFQFSPRLFGSPTVHSILRILSKEVLADVRMKRKISCYAYRSQNLDEACILNGCSIWKDARLYITPCSIDSGTCYQFYRL